MAIVGTRSNMAAGKWSGIQRRGVGWPGPLTDPTRLKLFLPCKSEMSAVDFRRVILKLLPADIFATS